MAARSSECDRLAGLQHVDEYAGCNSGVVGAGWREERRERLGVTSAEQGAGTRGVGERTSSRGASIQLRAAQGRAVRDVGRGAPGDDRCRLEYVDRASL